MHNPLICKKAWRYNLITQFKDTGNGCCIWPLSVFLRNSSSRFYCLSAFSLKFLFLLRLQRFLLVLLLLVKYPNLAKTHHMFVKHLKMFFLYGRICDKKPQKRMHKVDIFCCAFLLCFLPSKSTTQTDVFIQTQPGTTKEQA